MRRKANSLLPLEVSICEVALDLQGRGNAEFHGFAIAKLIKERDGARRLTAHGTLYKALSRMQDAGLLESRWEEPDIAARERRPQRRLYRITTAGARAVAHEHARRAGADAAVDVASKASDGALPASAAEPSAT